MRWSPLCVAYEQPTFRSFNTVMQSEILSRHVDVGGGVVAAVVVVVYHVDVIILLLLLLMILCMLMLLMLLLLLLMLLLYVLLCVCVCVFFFVFVYINHMHTQQRVNWYITIVFIPHPYVTQHARGVGVVGDVGVAAVVYAGVGVAVILVVVVGGVVVAVRANEHDPIHVITKRHGAAF